MVHGLVQNDIGDEAIFSTAIRSRGSEVFSFVAVTRCASRWLRIALRVLPRLDELAKVGLLLWSLSV
ncbi:hypothetical protein SESBI_28674 [Sesbania bispinosa]|nr:hypothetical protein SESBI_28674 [Sesbania bispinosa]